MSRFIIDDDVAKRVIEEANSPHYGTGWVPKPFELAGRVKNVRRFEGSTKSAAELIEGIRYRKANKADQRDVAEQAGVKILYQAQTPLCWMFGNVGQVLYGMAKSGQPVVPQSPASLAYKITGGRYRGGYNGEAIEGLAEIGTVPSEFWPDTSFDRKLDTAANDARRTKWAVEWTELETNNLDQLRTAIDNGFTVAMGLPWWGHLVFAHGLGEGPNGDILTDIANSWGTGWGDKGHGSLTPKKSLGDYIALRVIQAA